MAPRTSDLRRLIAGRWERLVSVRAVGAEDERLGRLFNVLVVVGTGVGVALTAVFLLELPPGLGGASSVAGAAFPFAFVPFSLGCLSLARRGRVRRAIELYVRASLFATSAAVWVFDGIRSPAWQLYAWTITIAGALLGPARALRMAGGVTAYVILLFSLDRLGVYAPPLTLGDGLVFVDIACRTIMLISCAGLLTYLNMRSVRDALSRLRAEVAERRTVEEEREQLVEELRESLANAKTLRGLLPICASCKSIRDDGGYWSRVEEYLARRTGARFSHGICPDCMEELYPDA